jgi:membrane fusion protein (multidrug efflux system)
MSKKPLAGSILSASAQAPMAQALMALALVALLAGCKEEQKQAGPPPKQEVTVVTLHAKPVSLTTDLPGRTTAYRVSEVRPQVSGVILKREFTEGDTVQAGQLLYQIDPAPYQASLASAQASLQHAQATVKTAQATVARYRPLSQAEAISKLDLDNAVGTLQQNQADVASAQAAVQTANINLAYTRVTAPITGKTSRSSVTEGALVTANQSNLLVTVTQLNPIYVDIVQPSTTLLRLKRELANGQLKTDGSNQAVVKLLLEDGTPYSMPGKLQFSEVSVDQGTGAVALRAIFPNDDGLLLPGMFVRGQIEEGVRQNGILAPQQGVTHNQKGEATALVVGADNKVALRVIKTDRAIGADWLVSDGLKDGDRVIVEGLQKVRPGAEVTVKEAAPPPASPAPAPAASK